MTVTPDNVFSIPENPNLHLKVHLEHDRFHFRLLHASKVVQRAWRRVCAYRVEIADRKRANNFKRSKAVVIQSVLRRHFARNWVSKIRAAKVR
jgi:hypothetical protein